MQQVTFTKFVPLSGDKVLAIAKNGDIYVLIVGNHKVFIKKMIPEASL